VVILGDKNIGKTCLIKRCIENSFSEHEDASLGAQFYSKKFNAELDQNMVAIHQLDPEIPYQKDVKL